MSVDVGFAKGYLDLDISGFLTGLRTAQSEADSASKNIATKMGGNLSNIGKGLTSAGTTLTKNVTLPILGIGAAGLKVATDFEKGMSEVKAITGSTGKELDALREKAIDLGADTAFSAGEVAEAMVEMAKAGWNSQQIIDGMSGVLSAAAASGEGLASVSTIVADTITGFGMKASDSTKVADLLTQAANSGTIGIADLGESFKYIAPVAGAMNLSIEDVTTAISAMSMAGIKGSQAGTSLRTMLSRMVKPTDEVEAAMSKLGVSITNQDGSMKSLDDIVSNLRDSFDGLTDSEKARYAATLAGQEGMSGMLSLLNLTKEEYDAIGSSMDDSSGVAEETAAVMQDNLQSKVEQLGGALESLAIKLADYLLPYVQQFVIWLTSLVDKFAALNPETQKTILKFAGLAAAAGPVLAIAGKLTTGIGGLVTAFGKLGGGFKAVSAGGEAGVGILAKVGGALAAMPPIVWIIIAIIAVLTAAFISLWKTNEEFRNKIKEIWNEIKETFERLTSGIVERLNSLGFDFENIGEVFKAIWKGICDFFAPVFTNAFQQISDTFTFIVDTILGTFDFFIAIFKGDWQGAWDAVKGIFESTWNEICSWFKNIANTFIGIAQTVLSWFGVEWNTSTEEIGSFFKDVWQGIVDFFVKIWTNIRDFFVNLWNGIVSFFTGVWEGIKNVVTVAVMFIVNFFKAVFDLITLPFRFIWENCKDTIISVWETIKSAVSTALNAVSTTITNVWNAVSTFFVSIWTSISNFISSVWNTIRTAISTAVNAIKTVITNIFNSIKTTVTNIWNGIKNAISVPINAAKTLISNVVNSIKNTISNGFNAAKNAVSNVFNSIKNTITNILNSAKTTVSNAINKIKSFFNFKWSLPKLKMPHFKITGSFSLNPPSVPKLSIDWYKKAMSGGMILNSATIFGYDSKSGQFLGGGEAGSETVVGTFSLMNMIRQAVAEAIKPILAITYKLAQTSVELGYVTYNGFVKQSQVLDKIIGSTFTGNGDTFNFYSPKALDEIEAAKQMKKAKRDLAEGF